MLLIPKAVKPAPSGNANPALSGYLKLVFSRWMRITLAQALSCTLIWVVPVYTPVWPALQHPVFPVIQKVLISNLWEIERWDKHRTVFSYFKMYCMTSVGQCCLKDRCHLSIVYWIHRLATLSSVYLGHGATRKSHFKDEVPCRDMI